MQQEIKRYESNARMTRAVQFGDLVSALAAADEVALDGLGLQRIDGVEGIGGRELFQLVMAHATAPATSKLHIWFTERLPAPYGDSSDRYTNVRPPLAPKVCPVTQSEKTAARPTSISGSPRRLNAISASSTRSTPSGSTASDRSHDGVTALGQTQLTLML